MLNTNKPTNYQQILEGSQAIAQTIYRINPSVVSAYPITPQTHIVEDLARLKADGKATFEYVRAESEFAAASIVAGASAAGARVYTATSSQGLLLMTEVLFNIAGMRLPVVLTCANRGVSAPITIWNDHQDAMTLRDAGWVMFFAENHQEAVEQHLLAYKIAEQAKLPAMVNVDGFVLTHTYEPVIVPSAAKIKKFLPPRRPAKDEILDPKNPLTFGAFAPPAYYLEIRQELHQDLLSTQKIINQEYLQLRRLIPEAVKPKEKSTRYLNGLVEYYGPAKPKMVLVAMGSLVGTIKDVVDRIAEVGVLKIKTFRPFPSAEVKKIIKPNIKVAAVEKAVSLGAEGPLAMELKTVLTNNTVNSFVVGLGGRDITEKMITKIIQLNRQPKKGAIFVGK
ncbi:pyruvate ferredoxin oxidoreductase [Candidatus Parcubacteria bacterium]|nr:MAG: pyruvate ferredoxin oxidoreductase [Candidatus Parcubacteria bacterium]